MADPVEEPIRGETIDGERLKALLSQEIAHAETNRAGTSDRNAKALDYYQGKVTKEIATLRGRSSLVSTDVSDAMGWILPAHAHLHQLG